ncbi:MAG: hypothetical protein EBR82_27720 [Caulobacteraceae bacterium]|nr:hypothetical protein [Caulobacteraceae bacterium]
MASINGVYGNEKSMSGVVDINDGAGVDIQDGDITCNNLTVNGTLTAASFSPTSFTLDNIVASSPTVNPNIYVGQTGTVQIGNASNQNIIGAMSVTGNAIVSTNGTPLTSSQNIRCSATPTIGNDLTNKTYVDAAVAGGTGGLLATTNVWTGTSNTFNNQIVASIINGVTSVANTIYTNLTTSGSLVNFGNRLMGSLNLFGTQIVLNVGASSNMFCSFTKSVAANQMVQQFNVNDSTPTTISTRRLLAHNNTTSQGGTINEYASSYTFQGTTVGTTVPYFAVDANFKMSGFQFLGDSNLVGGQYTIQTGTTTTGYSIAANSNSGPHTITFTAPFGSTTGLIVLAQANFATAPGQGRAVVVVGSITTTNFQFGLSNYANNGSGTFGINYIAIGLIP